MNEKVLGFKEKDAEPRGMGIEGFEWEHYAIGKKQLIPVVSLEWLEKQKCLTEKTRPISDEMLNAYLQGRLDFYYDLIEAATKQVGEKT